MSVLLLTMLLGIVAWRVYGQGTAVKPEPVRVKKDDERRRR